MVSLVNRASHLQAHSSKHSVRTHDGMATLTACVRAQTNGWRVQHVWHTSRDNCCAMKSMHAIRLRMLCQLAVEHPRKLEKARGAR